MGGCWPSRMLDWGSRGRRNGLGWICWEDLTEGLPGGNVYVG